MIRKIKKYLFIGLKQDQEIFFKAMQKKGLVEFLSKKSRQIFGAAGAAGPLIDAIKVLKTMPKKEQIRAGKPSISAGELAAKIVSSQEMVDSLQEEIKAIDAEIHRITPLGDFSLDKIRDIEAQTGRIVQFFCIKKDKLHQIETLGEYIYISSFFDLDFFMSISARRKKPEYMLEMRIEEDLDGLKKKKEQKLRLLKEKQQFLQTSADMIAFLHDAAVDAINAGNLSKAQDGADGRVEDLLFSIEGWMPEHRAKPVIAEFEKLGFIVEEIPIKEGERVPTHMTNKGAGQIGQDLVGIYDTPAPADKDPSTMVFFSFIVFYAMIISDAGYGFLYAILAFFMGWKLKNNKTSALQRFIKLFKVIALSTIVWGVLSGSYFGMELKPSNPVNRVSILNKLAEKKAQYHMRQQDTVYKEWVEQIPELKKATTAKQFLDMGIQEKEGKETYTVVGDFKNGIFLEIALIVGVIHIAISLLYVVRQNYSHIGWVLAIVGGYLYFPEMLDAASIVNFLGLIVPSIARSVGRDLMIVGVSLAVILDVVQNKIKGLISITKIIELFADILSYLRLYALGLAGMILASTFNDMGAKLMDSVGIILGVFAIVVGHAVNIVIGIMGGTIHGLRLNFIEWYHHCFEGGGKLFAPLKLLTKRR